MNHIGSWVKVKPRKLLPHLKKEIQALIEQDWSPQQVAGRLKLKFTHPYSSWEKGLIENTNKLIR
ncbi:MAG: hypothetical protein LBG15_00535, partial [Dysgonamonadaceae bacterium]|nr:hypothetical protein [Dysgonamonadaceae bacterium]